MFVESIHKDDLDGFIGDSRLVYGMLPLGTLLCGACVHAVDQAKLHYVSIYSVYSFKGNYSKGGPVKFYYYQIGTNRTKQRMTSNGQQKTKKL
jgi:hypothetical protein